VWESKPKDYFLRSRSDYGHGEAVHTPAWQWSLVVQTNPSSQGVLFAAKRQPEEQQLARLPLAGPSSQFSPAMVKPSPHCGVTPQTVPAGAGKAAAMRHPQHVDCAAWHVADICNVNKLFW